MAPGFLKTLSLAASTLAMAFTLVGCVSSELREARSGALGNLRVLDVTVGEEEEFSPDDLVVRRNDVIRFRALSPGHEITFPPQSNRGARPDSLPAPIALTELRRLYDLRIDLPTGRYRFVCPHHPGAVGSLLVVASAEAPLTDLPDRP